MGYGKYNVSPKEQRMFDGILFDSKKEMHRYMELKDMWRRGTIKNLELQPTFLLLEGFRYQGKKYRDTKYVADFRYLEDEKVVVEDVKGMRTSLYKCKIKFFLDKYGDHVDFRET